jgi:hypothetical protein
VSQHGELFGVEATTRLRSVSIAFTRLLVGVIVTSETVPARTRSTAVPAVLDVE